MHPNGSSHLYHLIRLYDSYIFLWSTIPEMNIFYIGNIRSKPETSNGIFGVMSTQTNRVEGNVSRNERYIFIEDVHSTR